MATLGLVFLFPLSSPAGDNLLSVPRPKTTIAQVSESPVPRSHYWMLASIAANVSANIADFLTTKGLREENPIIGNGANGRVNVRNLELVKLGFAGTQHGLEFWLHHKDGHQYDKNFAIGNFTAAGMIGALAAHNSTVK